MILVLLYSFNEADESIMGYRFCQKLLQEGHDLMVTTTTPKKHGLYKELKVAKQMRKKWGRKLKVVQPRYEEFEKPEPGWIDKYYKTYFWCLTKQTNVNAIVGLLPGTTKAAIALNKILKCKRLVLLATSKIDTDLPALRKEISTLSGYEIWSVGPDLFADFNKMFQDHGHICTKHKQFLLKPNEDVTYRNKKLRKVVSVWNQGHMFSYKGQWFQLGRSKPESFEIVGQALSEINHKYQTHTSSQRIKSNIFWHIYGITEEDGQSYLDKKIKVVPLSRPASLEEIEFYNSLAFIVPDEKEATFNFTALEAIWRGVPTLVPRESSIGKMLLQFPCPLSDHCLVNLTGNSKRDKIIWEEKIDREILRSGTNAEEWALQLSTFLRNSATMWHSVFSEQESSYKKFKHGVKEVMRYFSESSDTKKYPVSGTDNPAFDTETLEDTDSGQLSDENDSVSSPMTASIATQTDVTKDQEMDSRSVPVIESNTTQPEMTEDQEIDSKSVPVTESITTQPEMTGQEMDSKSVPVTESITTQPEMTEVDMDSKSAPVTESITTQPEMTEDQEMDSKSVPVTESNTTQPEMIEDQEMDSKSVPVTESITTQPEMTGQEMDSKSVPVTESITTQPEMTEDQEIDSKSVPVIESITTQPEVTEDQEIDSRSVPVTESITTHPEMIEDQEMDSKSTPVTESITTQPKMTGQEMDSKCAPVTKSITTQPEMIGDQELDSKCPSPLTESITTQSKMKEDQEIDLIDLTSASVTESITTRTEFSKDEERSYNSVAASCSTKIHGDSIQQVSLQVATPSEQSRDKMSIQRLKIPSSLLEIAQGIICRVSKSHFQVALHS